MLVLLGSGVASLARREEGDDGIAATPRASTTTAAPTVAAGEVRVTGPVTAARIDGVVVEDLPMPITIEAAAPGAGNGATLQGVRVNGAGATIAWDGGRPLALSGTGLLVVAPTAFRLDAGRLRAELGGATHTLTAGGYRIDTPVAVGTTGIAEPRDAVDLSAPADASFTGTGSVLVTLPARAWTFTGPGAVVLEGSFEVSGGPDRAGATGPASRLELSQGLFELHLTGDPATGGWTVEARLRGEPLVTR